jgi:hypothetical protein
MYLPILVAALVICSKAIPVPQISSQGITSPTSTQTGDASLINGLSGQQNGPKASQIPNSPQNGGNQQPGALGNPMQQGENGTLPLGQVPQQGQNPGQQGQQQGQTPNQPGQLPPPQGQLPNQPGQGQIGQNPNPNQLPQPNPGNGNANGQRCAADIDRLASGIQQNTLDQQGEQSSVQAIALMMQNTNGRPVDMNLFMTMKAQLLSYVTAGIMVRQNNQALVPTGNAATAGLAMVASAQQMELSLASSLSGDPTIDMSTIQNLQKAFAGGVKQNMQNLLDVSDTPFPANS